LLSSYRWVEKYRQREPHPFVDIHPETAAAYEIQDGDTVIIKTKNGEIEQVARLTDKVIPQVVCAALGWWFPEGSPAEQYEWRKSNLNMLTSIDELGKEFGTPNLKNLPCQISKK
jgi:anaerobic selenocysteine-containing dehydrogenase